MIRTYDKEHCWQYEVRLRNAKGDLAASSLTSDQIEALRVSNFRLEYVPKDDKEGCHKVREFIERHEWLGKLPIWATHRFVAICDLNEQIAGAIVMATPNTFSHMLGKENRGKEKLIARGACISWAPKNLGSWVIMQSVKWMVQNTEFRAFSGYSDPEARELGTIYQACNFFYLGQKSGTTQQFFDPKKPKKGWFGSRTFNERSTFVRIAKENNIPWEHTWYRDGTRKIDWKKVPDDIEKRVKQAVKDYKALCQARKVPKKHKYTLILGKTRRETKELQKLFLAMNPEQPLPYPKNRGE
tara:strand:+ start:2566 stop:3462 length:897 start_codon:yes stop_codon:yes gene_type:complete